MKTSLILFASLFILCGQILAADRPNILLILVDDVGYSDISAFAARANHTSTDQLFYETPRLDKLAREGTLFTQFYACTVCAPTRASLMTGKMNNRMGMWDAWATVNTTFEKTGKPVPAGCHILDNEPWNEYHYNKTDRGVTVPIAATALHDVKTIPQGLTGYHSAFIGKWHLGSHNHEGYRPEDRGFQELLAYYDAGGSSYRRPFKTHAGKNWDMPGEPLVPPQDYLCDDIAQRVNRFLAERATKKSDKPFFLYVAHPACHVPIQSRADDLAYFKDKSKKPEWAGHKTAAPEYAGLLKGMDRSIGAMLDKLDDLGLADNTAVIFLSDNGGYASVTSNAPLRGGKSMLYEGGIRVPMIVRWPGRTTAGAVCDVTSDVADIYPTLMEIAGVDYSDFKADKTMDGKSLTPLFTDLKNLKKNYPRDSFYWFYGKMGYTGYHQFATWAALRRGDFKLHYDYQGKVALYNIAKDISEKNDLAHAQPKLALAMLDDLTGWLRTNCNAAYLPKANPDFNPQGPLPYGPYIPFENLKESLFHDTPEDLEN